MKPKNKSYRQLFGVENPPAGTALTLKKSEGIKWYLRWDECPDHENIVEGWFDTKQQALDYADKNGWPIKPATA